MAANGISTLSTKEARQVAKLELASTKRAQDGNPRATYDITELPTQYSGNEVVANSHPDGLIEGRPWISGTPAPSYVIQFRSITGDPNNLSTIQPADIITTCNEGDVIWFSVIGTNVPNDPNAYLQFGGANITNQDASVPFFANILDPIPYNNYGTDTQGAPIGINTDNLTEGNETLTLSWIVFGDIVATASITIVDTSTGGV